MGRPERMFRNQYAVLWSFTGVDRFGEPLFDEPEELKVRWEERQEEFLDVDGGTQSVDVVVTVNELIPVQSVMWKGKLEDYDEAQSNLRLQVAMRKIIPDIKARVTSWVVGLKRFRSTNPADPSASPKSKPEPRSDASLKPKSVRSPRAGRNQKPKPADPKTRKKTGSS